MTTESEPTRVVIPVVQESVEIAKQARPTGVVHVRRHVHEEMEEIDEALESTEVVVERVPVGAWIDEAPAERREGDTVIIPVVEEVPVVVMRLRLVEEVRVTRQRTIRRYRDRVPVRRSDVTIEREEAEREEAERPAPPPPTPNHPTRDHPTPEHRRRRMTMTVIGLFQTPEPARRACRDLVKAGCPEESVQLFDTPRDDLDSALAEIGIDAEDARAFSGAIAKGAAVIAVEAEDDRADDIRARLEKSEARAVDVYEDETREQGGKAARGERKVLPEVEEQVRIGKRRVVRGVHASTHVTERPVEKTLTLEEEKVRVRHREADRELSPEEAERAFQETSLDLTETTEEAEVRKAARLIGEVELTKSTSERKETVKETARKTEVDVERTGGRSSKK